MQIAIDIPEEVYKEICDKNYYSLKGKEALRIGVINGTVLPKGHGRIGDLDALNNGLREQQRNYEHTSGIRRPINEAVKDGIIIARTHIDYAPTIIEADKTEREE